MAALIDDFGGANYSSFHSAAPRSSYQPQPQQQTSQPHTKQPHHQFQQSRSSLSSPLGTASGSSAHSQTTSTPPSSSSSFADRKDATNTQAVQEDATAAANDPCSFAPAEPSVSNQPNPAPGVSQERDGSLAHMEDVETEADNALVATSTPPSGSNAATVVPAPVAARPPPPTNAIPSPASDGEPRWVPTGTQYSPMPAAPLTSHVVPPPRTQKTIRICDLADIQRLAQLDSSTGNGPGILNDPPLQDMKFEISDMPIGDIIEMVAALLTKITTTNDQQHDALNRNASRQRHAQAHNDGSEVHASPYSTSVLAFHGKNVPAITILSYLARIHKYCPTTYEVFLSLLVYFDRMAERVNDLVMKDEEERQKKAEQQKLATQTSTATDDTPMQDSGENADQDDETDEGLADSDDDVNDTNPKATTSTNNEDLLPDSAPSIATYFVVDSFNIHRLIIAGVTCASKFFSDVFYTNSRYAKVGGLPLPELNHLELQFLILNDFRLAIPLEDLEAYATMLVEFYAREVVGHRTRPST